MKPEDKQLLLQDLSARLPYGVKCQFEDIIRVTDGESSPFYNYVLSSHHLELFMRHNNFYIKPYLRPMSSMTEEEIIEFNNIPSTKNYTIIENDLPWDVAHYKQIDWLNKKMFDYRCLISKDLAIELTEDNNTYKDRKEREIETQRNTHPSRKKIEQIDKSGYVVANYQSIREAERMTGIIHNNICECLKGRRKSAGGYYWKYISD